MQELHRPFVPFDTLDGSPLVLGQLAVEMLDLQPLVRIAEKLLLFDERIALLFEGGDAARKQAVQKTALRFAVLLEVFRRPPLIFRRFRKAHFGKRHKERRVIFFQLAHLARPHFRRQKQPQGKGHGHAVTRRELAREGQTFGIERGQAVGTGKDALQPSGRDVRRLFQAHDKPRDDFPAEGRAHAAPRLYIVVAEIIVYSVRLARGDIHNHFRYHSLVNPLCPGLPALKNGLPRKTRGNAQKNAKFYSPSVLGDDDLAFRNIPARQ